MMKRKTLSLGLTLLGITGIGSTIAVCLTSCSNSEDNTYQAKLEKLFDFPNLSKFLPSELTKSALVDNQYDSIDELNNSKNIETIDAKATKFSELLELFKNPIANLLCIDINAIKSTTSSKEKNTLNYIISLSNDDDVCKFVYKKDFDEIAAEIQNTTNYKEMLTSANSSSSNIKTIELKFEFKWIKNINSNIMGFELNQIVNLSFNNESKDKINFNKNPSDPQYTFNVFNNNNIGFNNKKILFLVLLDKNGDLGSIKNL